MPYGGYNRSVLQTQWNLRSESAIGGGTTPRRYHAVSSESVRAGTPATEDDCEVCTIHDAIVRHVCVKLSSASIGAPYTKQHAEINAIDFVVARDIAGARRCRRMQRRDLGRGQGAAVEPQIVDGTAESIAAIEAVATDEDFR